MSNDMSDEDLLLFMDDNAQMVRDIRNGKTLEQSYPPGINNKWNNNKIYNKSNTKYPPKTITNKIKNRKKILQTRREFPAYNKIVDSLQFQNDLKSGSYIHDVQ